MENHLAGLQKRKHWITIWSSNSTVQYMPKRDENMLHKDLDTNVYSGIIRNSWKVETTRMSSVDEWISKLWSTHTMEYYVA